MNQEINIKLLAAACQKAAIQARIEGLKAVKMSNSTTAPWAKANSANCKGGASNKIAKKHLIHGRLVTARQLAEENRVPVESVLERIRTAEKAGRDPSLNFAKLSEEVRVGRVAQRFNATRKCLRCGIKFISGGAGHRICPDCAVKNASVGALAWH